MAGIKKKRKVKGKGKAKARPVAKGRKKASPKVRVGRSRGSIVRGSTKQKPRGRRYR